MNIEQALERVKGFLDYSEDESSDQYYVGEAAWNVWEHINYLYEFAKTVKAVHTTHDSKAESDEWDRFFEDIQKETNGKS